ncbi:T9SS type A sorting domain-containing protein [Pontibacter sp. HJ8]
MIRKLTILVACFLVHTFSSFAQFADITNLQPVEISTNTSEKPQSKVWSYNGKHWAVLPNATGTHLWRLDGTTWTSMLKLSDKTTSKADCKLVGNMAHILLFQGGSSELASVEFQASSDTYQFWSKRTGTAGLKFNDKAETATIEMDGKGRMWLASDGSSSIHVQWSDSPYNKWSSLITVASGVTSDDLGAIIALPGKIGVLWSNQNTDRFGFKTHADGDDPTVWSADEVPASQSALAIGNGMADDHMNMAVAGDGTLYCAVKTSYDNRSYPEIALLVRRPSGSWDNLYEVSKTGTRPIVVLDESRDKVIVIYTSQDSGGNILYKEALISDIQFTTQLTLMAGSLNNATSTKANFSEDIVVLASSATHAVGVLASNPVIPLPVELHSFAARPVGDDVLLQWITASETDNAYFTIEASADGADFAPIGTVPGRGTTQLQSRYAFTDKDIYRYNSDQVYYRLRQVDYSGEETLGPVRVVQPATLANTLSLRAFPNPFRNHLQVQISANGAEQATIMLYDLQGKTIFSQQFNLKLGQNKLSLTEVPLSPGIYLLSVRTESQQQLMKVLRE